MAASSEALSASPGKTVMLASVAPVVGITITPGYSDEIGADVYCPDAATAARSAVALLRGA